MRNPSHITCAGKCSLLKEELDRIAWSGDFNCFRKNYKSFTFEELKHLYGIWLLTYPVQSYFNRDFFLSCINCVSKELGRLDLKIVELGGYQGELALEAFTLNPQLDWLNIEIIQHKPVNGLEHCKYLEHVLSKQVWEEDLNIGDRDLFVSGDTLEHFPDEEFEQIVTYVAKNRLEFLAFRIPIGPDGGAGGGTNTHQLNMGSNNAKELIGQHYTLILEKPGWNSFWRRSI